MHKYILLYFILLTSSAFAQDKIQRLLPNQQKFKDYVEEVGNPLEGNPVLLINYFAEKEGSYLFYFNEAKAKGTSYLTEKPKDLYAGIYLEDHGGILKQITFKDFAGPLSQPDYLLDYCIATDADKNKSPEFYLTYFEESDSLDTKPLKVIIYSKNEKLLRNQKSPRGFHFNPKTNTKLKKMRIIKSSRKAFS